MMMRTLFLAAMLASASAVLVSHLRGAPEAEKKADKKETTKSMLNPLKVDERGPRGHFYYAQTCDDCFYKAPQCGCEPAVEYFACLTKHCHDSKTVSFAEKCTTLSNKCFKDISLSCKGPETVCTSKFSQLPTGGLGFDLDIDEDDAYCGPHGKCIGEIKLKAHIKNGPQEEKKVEKAPDVTVASPAPGPMAPSAPAPASAAVVAPVKKPVKEEKKQEIWLECGLPKKENANIDDKHDWILCQKEVKEEKEKCKIPMFSELKAGAHKKAYCVLTDGKDGKRLTQPHWSKVINIHEKPKPSNATAVVAKKPEEPEAKAPKPEAKAKEPKAEESKPKAAPKKDEKPKEETKQAPLASDDSDKLPWMVEKEKRAAAKKVKEAEEAKKEKEEDKKEVVEKKAEKPAAPVENDSALPWMKGKATDKAAPAVIG